MLDIGKTLRDKRKELGRSLEDIHDDTRVSVQHIQFLEQNNFTFLPETYVKSFLKNVSESLGLNATEILENYQAGNAEVVHEEDQPEKPVPEEHAPGQTVQGTSVIAITQQKRPFLEWGLGLGAFALLILLVFSYVQFRSQIAINIKGSRPAFQTTAAHLDLAKINVRQVVPHDSLTIDPPLELQVTALTDISLWLSIDSLESAKHSLAARQSFVWIARNHFEMTLSQAGTAESGSDSSGTAQADSGMVMLSISKKHLADGRSK